MIWSLEEAIKNKYMSCPYLYFVFVDSSSEEMSAIVRRYVVYTRRVAK